MPFSVAFLGGVGEIGLNMYLYESEECAFIVDCGLSFADMDIYGVDYEIPNFDYLYKIKDKLEAIVITHGHEDHIGALTYLTALFRLPVYAGQFAMKLIKYKFSEKRTRPLSYNYLTNGESFNIKDITITPIEITHSIPDAFVLKISSKKFNALHFSDFKIDMSPYKSNPFPLDYIKSLSKDKIDLLLIDSTNGLEKKISESESVISESLEEIFQKTEGRIFFTTFSSNVARLNQLIDTCRKFGRKLVIEGRSIHKNLSIAQELEHSSTVKDIIIQAKDMSEYIDKEICLLISGSQGEANSSLAKIVKQEMRFIKIKDGDLLILSSRVIPGNEKRYNQIINQFYLLGGRCVDHNDYKVHVSGHARLGDIINIIKYVKPKYVIPIHGEYIHLKNVCENVKKGNKHTESIFLKNGDKITFQSKSIYKITNVTYGKKYIDLRGGFLLDEDDLKERKNLSRFGAVSVVIKKDATEQKLVFPPLFETSGFRMKPEYVMKFKKYFVDNQLLLNETYESLSDFKEFMIKFVRRFFKKNFDRRPVVTIFITEGDN